MKGTGQIFALMYLTFASTQMSPEQVTEFLTRVVQPRFATLEGVGSAEILGGRDFAMRVWLDPLRLASRNVTATDVLAAIRASNFLAAPGKTKNEYVAYALEMQTTLQTPEAFGALPIARCRRPGGATSGRGARRTRPQEHRYHRDLQWPGRHLYRRDAEPSANPLTVANAVTKGDRRDRPDAAQGHDGRSCL